MFSPVHIFDFKYRSKECMSRDPIQNDALSLLTYSHITSRDNQIIPRFVNVHEKHSAWCLKIYSNHELIKF